MNDGKSPVSATQSFGLAKGARRKSTRLVRLVFVLALLALVSPAAALAAPPAGPPGGTPASAESDAARLAALVRFYTDRHERAANAGSAQYRARATYVRDVLFADEFGGFDDPARWTAVARFLTDRHERSACAGSSQYIALANSLRGIERVRAESTPVLSLSANEP